MRAHAEAITLERAFQARGHTLRVSVEHAIAQREALAEQCPDQEVGVLRSLERRVEAGLFREWRSDHRRWKQELRRAWLVEPLDRRQRRDRRALDADETVGLVGDCRAHAHDCDLGLAL